MTTQHPHPASELIAALTERYAPRTTAESACVRDLACIQWRLDRLVAEQISVLSYFSLMASGRELTRLHRDEMACRREADSLRADLARLQQR